ncbi:MAG: DNA double-strand break repair nuclease NurA [Chloroflexi bacterium]|nr:DNA double-strand break repair nuclease NurA [Chloroflexota bacterium]
MPIDWNQLVPQVEAAAELARGGQGEGAARLRLALQTLGRAEAASLAAKTQASRVTWLVAGLTPESQAEGLGRALAPAPLPSEWAVLGVDGSHLELDRHRPLACYLINIGAARLRYGPQPQAELSSRPSLFFREEELALADPEGLGEEAVAGAILGWRRAVMEMEAAAGLAASLPPALPTLVMLDGTLVLWGLAGREYQEGKAYVRQALLDGGFLPALERLRRLSEVRPLALASYISLPRATEVVNLLRLALCPHEPADCDRYCSAPGQGRECQAVAGVLDREVFGAILAPGQRSASFASRSSVMERHYGPHGIRFCYLRGDDEVARLEYPAWVEELGLLGLAATLALDQARRGLGYPVALAEAHQQAVVSGADREVFWRYVDAALRERRLAASTSAKSRSKRQPWL